MYRDSYIEKLKCILCNAEYDPSEVEYVCPKHGYDGRLDIIYNYDKIKKIWNKNKLRKNNDYSIWRYLPLLPVQPVDFSRFLSVGWTPLYKSERLNKKLGLNNLYLKCDLFNPTASLKDRASIIGVIKAIENNKKIITAASSGNAASSIAGIAANAGLKSVLFVPVSAPKEKVVQMCIYGATVFLVDSTYDDAFDLCLEASDKFGWYSRNTGYNPYLSEGKKTVILESMEQMNWDSPDSVFVPVGDGCIIGSVNKGIKDLIELGWIAKKPRIFGVQAEGASALYNAWKNNTEKIEPIETNTIADSIAVSLPRDGIKALRAVKETNGEYVKVQDKKIIDAVNILAKYTGIFAEPAGAAGLAAVIALKDENKIQKDEKIIVLITGSGLKDIKSASTNISKPILIKSDIKDVEKYLNKII